jgi:hypothetical protein
MGLGFCPFSQTAFDKSRKHCPARPTSPEIEHEKCQKSSFDANVCEVLDNQRTASGSALVAAYRT